MKYVLFARLLIIPLFFAVRAWGETELRFVGYELPPYMYRDETGEVTGFSVELVDQVCKKLGLSASFRIYPWQRALLMFERGNADGLINVAHCDSLALTTRRDEGTDDPDQGPNPAAEIWQTDSVVFLSRSLVPAVEDLDLDDMVKRGYRLAFSRACCAPQAVSATDLNRSYANPSTGIRALAAREIDMLVCDRTVGRMAIEAAGVYDKITCLPRSVSSKPQFVVLRGKKTGPGGENLSARLAAELSHFRTSADYSGLKVAHCSGLPRPGDRPLVFVCESWKPFEYQENGEVRGLDAEVVERIMGRLGIPYVIRFYPWSRAWMMVEKGAADAVLSISYKKSREEYLYYTPEQKAYPETSRNPPDYLWLSEYFFFVKKSRMPQLRFVSYDQMKRDGYSIGTNKDYSYSPDFPAAKLSTHEFNSTRDGFMALVKEEIDLYPMDRTVGLAELNDMGLLGSVTYIPKPLFDKPYLAPFCKGSDYPALPRVMEAFNRELRAMRASGEYEDIFRRYCGGIRLPDDSEEDE